MATQTRNPTSDEAASGTLSGSAGTRWQFVDDHPDTAGADVLTFGTTTAQITFGFSAFSVPAGSTSISVQVLYYDGEAATGANNCCGRLKVGTSYFNAATHNPSGTTYTARSDDFATNPATSAAWTVDQVNGVGANALAAFGIGSTDSNPTFRVSSVQLQVTYSLAAITGSGSSTASTQTSTGAGSLDASSSGSASPGAATSSGAGAVSIAGSGSALSSAATSTGIGEAAGGDITGSGAATGASATSTGAGLSQVAAIGSSAAAVVSSSGLASVSIAAIGSAGVAAVSAGVGVTSVSGSGAVVATNGDADGSGINGEDQRAVTTGVPCWMLQRGAGRHRRR